MLLEKAQECMEVHYCQEKDNHEILGMSEAKILMLNQNY